MSGLIRLGQMHRLTRLRPTTKFETPSTSSDSPSATPPSFTPWSDVADTTTVMSSKTTSAQIADDPVPSSSTQGILYTQGNWDKLAIFIIDIGEIVLGARVAR